MLNSHERPVTTAEEQHRYRQLHHPTKSYWALQARVAELVVERSDRHLARALKVETIGFVYDLP